MGRLGFRRRPQEVPAYRSPSRSEAPRLLPEPWTQHHLARQAGLVPTDVLATIADPGELARLRRRQPEYLADLREQIMADGVREPLELAVDANGRICVQNGHHRVIVAIDAGIERLPVRWVRSEGVRMHSVPAREVIGPIVALPPVRDQVLRRAAEFALAAIEDAGAQGWALGDAVCALELALGRPVSADARRRMASIDPSLAESTR